jgi:hypothetical protein
MRTNGGSPDESEQIVKPETVKDPHRIFVKDGRRIDEALQRGVRQALLEHRREGRPVVVFRNGRTMQLEIEEIDSK